MKPIMLFLWVASLVFQIVYCLVEIQGYNCTEEEIDRNKTLAYIGWPYTLKCGLFTETEGLDVYDKEYSNTTINCLILESNGTLLLNITTDYEQFGYHPDEINDVNLPDLNRDSNVDFQMYLFIPEEQRCLFIKIHLQLIPFKNQTCDGFIKSKHLKHCPSYKGKNINMSCAVPLDMYPVFYHYDIVTYHWTRNCSTLPQTTTLSSRNSSLEIKHLEYEQAGLYICSITYNGMTRYILIDQICVTSKPATTNHTLTCSKIKEQKNVGEEAEFKCLAAFGVQDTTLECFWYKEGQKNNKSICLLADKAVYNMSETSCFYEYKRKCFLNVATKEEQSQDESGVHVRLYFKNIKPDDFSQYILECSTTLQNLVNVTVSLEEDNNFKQTIIIVSIIACFVVLVLVIMMTAICFPVYFHVYYKRYFGSYTKENRKYDAYLLYNFSTESDVFIQEETSETTIEVSNILKKMGYSVYDCNRDGYFGQSQIEANRSIIEQSHRTVIILTEQFIKDDSSMSNLYEGFKNMIFTKSKLIFILLPGVKEYVDQRAKTEPAYKGIKSAIANNYAILWSNKNFNSKNFKFQFEYAMPKLKSQNLSQKCNNTSINYRSLYNDDDL